MQDQPIVKAKVDHHTPAGRMLCCCWRYASRLKNAHTAVSFSRPVVWQRYPEALHGNWHRIIDRRFVALQQSSCLVWWTESLMNESGGWSIQNWFTIGYPVEQRTFEHSNHQIWWISVESNMPGGISYESLGISNLAAGHTEISITATMDIWSELDSWV